MLLQASKKIFKIVLFALVLLIVTIGYRLFGDPHSNFGSSVESVGASDPSPDPSPGPSPDPDS